MPSLQIRAMTRAELDLGIEWAAREGWNPGLHDADTFHATDPEGFLVGLLDGEPVGMVSAVRYGRSFGFIGFYIVRPEHRGHGHGLALWTAAMQRLQGRTIGLDGVVAQQANYRRSGFELAWNNARYQGATRRFDPDPAVVPLSQFPLEAVLDLDAASFPDDRRSFARRWIAQPGSIALGLKRADRLSGYGVIRPCRTGSKIGPLFADDPDGADALYRALVSRIEPGTQVQFDVPVPHAGAVALARDHGLSPVFETARMYAGPAPALPMHRVFGVTTFELG